MMCCDATATLADMPDEIILRIARILDRAPDIVRLGSTCSHYNRLLRDKHLWKSLCLTQFGPPLHEGFLDAGKSWQWLYRAQGSNARLAGVDVGALMTPGRIYWGDTLDGLPHGYGLSIALPTKHRDGRGITRRHHDCDLDNGTPRHDGYWFGGRASGYGVRVYRNGSRYRGMWHDDLHHGYGERVDKQGWTYVGEWSNGHPHGEVPCGDAGTGRFHCCGIDYARSDLYDFMQSGQGGDDIARSLSLPPPQRQSEPAARVLLWNRADQAIDASKHAYAFGGVVFLPDGVIYARARNGDAIRGTVTWPDGRHFVGRWASWHVNRQLTAIGTMTHPDGRVQNGPFSGDRLRGRAVVTYSDGVRVEAVWSGDYVCGPANVSWPDGRRYVGSWDSGSCHGQGRMTWPDGRHYVGSWDNGSCHGRGRMTWPDGSRWTGTWVNGQAEATPSAHDITSDVAARVVAPQL
ncbi:Morn repeat incomplete domain containing protein [Pandoravirus neocaledonia]|uniref:Morn repeat incomplete domain containing protein n=1 Tax=Pandoravirus neocaledonia TaxID=2107708 RepID=A0A2U7UCF0_9VIRU|nr:Morn repeat incomplete domain containing protein [Pandoravirus neocaledonia]AVK76035.1 Morn repeat incomplete domain containing protein [Pandoravirus neocaledonia]